MLLLRHFTFPCSCYFFNFLYFMKGKETVLRKSEINLQAVNERSAKKVSP